MDEGWRYVELVAEGAKATLLRKPVQRCIVGSGTTQIFGHRLTKHIHADFVAISG